VGPAKQNPPENGRRWGPNTEKELILNNTTTPKKCWGEGEDSGQLKTSTQEEGGNTAKVPELQKLRRLNGKEKVKGGGEIRIKKTRRKEKEI